VQQGRQADHLRHPDARVDGEEAALHQVSLCRCLYDHKQKRGSML
jgi:hypothetical protein